MTLGVSDKRCQCQNPVFKVKYRRDMSTLILICSDDSCRTKYIYTRMETKGRMTKQQEIEQL